MARTTPNRYPVRLTDERRVALEALTTTGRAPVSKVRHARVLLLSDRGRPGGPYAGPGVADAVGMRVNTARIRKRFVLGGEPPALGRKPRATPPVPPKIDGRVEAHLVAICCSDPPVRGVPGREGPGVGEASGGPPHAGPRELAERGRDRVERPGPAVPGPADRVGRRVGARGGRVGPGPERHEGPRPMEVHDPRTKLRHLYPPI